MKQQKYTALIPSLLTAIVVFCASAWAAPDQSDEDWFELDDEFDYQAFMNINEGELNFLETPPDKPVHHHQNTLVIGAQSLEDGWVTLKQCHDNLDEFPSAQVTYSKERVKDLKISSADNIDSAWVEDSTVQLRNVRAGAKLCVSAKTRSLTRNADGSYTMRNGPFMRKFLDGYFPMRVSVNVQMPEQLQFASVSPRIQKGFRVTNNAGKLTIDALFEGRLRTEIRFNRIGN